MAGAAGQCPRFLCRAHRQHAARAERRVHAARSDRGRNAAPVAGGGGYAGGRGRAAQTLRQPAARSTLAARDLPGGEEFYPYLIRKFTTTDLTPEQIHAIGKSEVARIKSEMEAIARSTGFTGTIAEFNDALRAGSANCPD
ncbi:DUF885 family protein [Altererythrobacter sp. FM1]|nr:DUF885 family protein [Altererythrobacter sp. FM1]